MNTDSSNRTDFLVIMAVGGKCLYARKIQS